MVILITGGSSGIGLAAARALAAEHTVLITGRSPQTIAIAQELNGEAYLCDFGKLSDVRAVARAILQKHKRIDLLVNNVGGLMGSIAQTEDGHERTLQVNHLAPFLLTQLLQPCLEASRGSVINTSSAAHWMGHVNPNSLATPPGMSPYRAYAMAKLLNILHATEINRRFAGVRAVSFHPGPVATAFARESALIWRLIYETPLKNLVLISPQRGADTLLWLIAHARDGTWDPGGYYVRRKLAMRNRQARDAALAASVWDQSLRAMKLGPAPMLRAVPQPL